MSVEISEIQRKVCVQFGAEPLACPDGLKVGLSRSVREGELPVNGLRHPAAANTTGWFIWAGESLSDDADFFQAVHVEHLRELCPEVLGYLALPPGWRFLWAPGQEDVWFDEKLLDI